MIEVIERGVVPEDRVYECRCRRCKSLLRFKRSDASLMDDQRDGDYLTVRCPVCTEPVSVTPGTGFTRGAFSPARVIT